MGVGCGDLSGKDGPNTWEHGQRILQEIKNISFEGLTGINCNKLVLKYKATISTGQISFDDQGRRKNYTLDVMEMTHRSEMVQIGRWSEEDGLIISDVPVFKRQRPSKTRLA